MKKSVRSREQQYILYYFLSYYYFFHSEKTHEYFFFLFKCDKFSRGTVCIDGRCREKKPNLFGMLAPYICVCVCLKVNLFLWKEKKILFDFTIRAEKRPCHLIWLCVYRHVLWFRFSISFSLVLECNILH